MNKTRLTHLDVAKALGIIAVIFAHVTILYALSSDNASNGTFAISRVIYAWHMPLFFMISGVFFSLKGIRTSVVTSMVYIMIAIITEIPGAALSLVVGKDDWTLRKFAETVFLMRGYSLGVTWFLVALALARLLLSIVLEGRAPHKVLALAVVFASFCSTVLIQTTIFQMQAIWAAVLFLFAGFATKNFFMDRVRTAKAYTLAAALIVEVTLVGMFAFRNHGCAFDPLLPCNVGTADAPFIVRMIIGQYGEMIYFLGGAFAGIFAVVSIGALLTRILPARILDLASYVGQNTLSLVLLNGLFLVVGNHFLRKLIPSADELWLAVLIALFTVVLHLSILPLAVPAVRFLERLCLRGAETVVSLGVERCLPIAGTTDPAAIGQFRQSDSEDRSANDLGRSQKNAVTGRAERS